MNVFLSVEEDLPLGIFIGTDYGCEVMSLDDFFNASLIGLSAKQCERYAEEFEKFTAKLKAGSEF